MRLAPFVDYQHNPLLSPKEGSFFSRGIYNPTVVESQGEIFMLFRAEGEEKSTGSIGLAKSKDGIHFVIHPEPVIIPDSSFDKFGCEDPRVTKFKDTYYLTYVGNCGEYYSGNICLATSKDLISWQKHGRIIKPKKESWNRGQIKAGAILNYKINDKFIMYFMGEEKPWVTSIGIAYSDDLFSWYELKDEPLVLPREGYFDSQGVEPGPNPILIDEGILLIYNGWGRDCVYKVGALLFSQEDPEKLIYRTDEPILTPKVDYGRRFNTLNHTVAEGLIKYKDSFFLYYGGADRVVCLATYKCSDSDET